MNLELPTRLALLVGSLTLGCGPGLPSGGNTADGDGGGASDGSTSANSGTGPVGTSTSAQTSGVDSTSEGGDVSTSSSFIDDPTDCGDPDSRWHCTPVECEIGSLDCLDGDKCVPWANDGGSAWNASRCTPVVERPGSVGDPCTMDGSPVSGVDTCDRASMCWGVDPETLEGTCRIFFGAQAIVPDCDAAHECVVLNEGYVPLCLLPCNPLQPDACGEGEECRFATDSDGLYCLPEVGGQILGNSRDCVDQTCSPAELCAPAKLLPSCEVEGCCTPWCDITDPGADEACAALDPERSCLPFYADGKAPEGAENLGMCGRQP
ncbi:MAG: hypothetical protein AAF799_38395 [Myxococcota bacterium]